MPKPAARPPARSAGPRRARAAPSDCRSRPTALHARPRAVGGSAVAPAAAPRAVAATFGVGQLYPRKDAINARLNQAHRVPGYRVKEGEIAVGVVALTTPYRVSQERSASASDRGRRGPRQAGPVAELAGLHGMS